MALSGNLSETSFTDLIQFYNISRQTAALTVVSPAGPEHDVVVFMENGEIIDARFGEMGGIDAVRRAMRLREGEFHVELNVSAKKRTIWESCSKLLLDEMVSDDEAQNGAGKGAGATAAGPEKIVIPKKQPPPSPQRRSSFPIILASAAIAAAAVGGALWWRSQQEAAAATARQATLAVQRQAEVRARPAVQGVTHAEIVFGMAAPFSGPAKELGRGMKTGIVGTPTAEVAVPFTLEKKMLFFGPFTGAGLLRRDPPDRYVFNYRASYAEETAATVKYLVTVRRVAVDEIAVFAQQDGYGDAGFNGVAKMLRKYNRNPERVLRVGYKRNTGDVNEAVSTLLRSRHPVRAVVMVATYKAAAKFIDKVKAERPDIVFSNVSFVGSQALADELMSYGGKVAEGVIVTQVVPLPQSKATAVLRYQELLPKYSLGEKPDFVSLEGYLAASLLIEGLKRAGRHFTTETLVDALEDLRALDLGVGATMGFGMSEHQASHKVWGTVLDASGNFQTIDME